MSADAGTKEIMAPSRDKDNGVQIEECDVDATNSNPQPSASDWVNFSQWMHCFCVVTFDLNLGQALEHVYPPQFMPSEQEVSNICYMAFPDSNSGCMGDTKFHMRLRCTSRRESLPGYNAECSPALRQDASHYWGFVYFRQKRDANLPRGYFQKSFIIITRLPFFNLYYDILSQLAPRYFDEGTDVLRLASEQINRQWPGLRVGNPLQLPLLECSYQICIPRTSSSRKSTADSSGGSGESPPALAACPTAKVLTSVNEIELFRSLDFVMEQLYTLWELVITAEPIVVVGTSPADCSHMVQTLLALIAPLEYCAEARPYFTIHDSEFREFTQECTSKTTLPACILGVTNPFFVKLLKDWPHMLRLVDNQVRGINKSHKTSYSTLSPSRSFSEKHAAATAIADGPKACEEHRFGHLLLQLHGAGRPTPEIQHRTEWQLQQWLRRFLIRRAAQQVQAVSEKGQGADQEGAAGPEDQAAGACANRSDQAPPPRVDPELYDTTGALYGLADAAAKGHQSV